MRSLTRASAILLVVAAATAAGCRAPEQRSPAAVDNDRGSFGVAYEVAGYRKHGPPLFLFLDEKLGRAEVGARSSDFRSFGPSSVEKCGFAEVLCLVIGDASKAPVVISSDFASTFEKLKAAGFFLKDVPREKGDCKTWAVRGRDPATDDGGVEYTFCRHVGITEIRSRGGTYTLSSYRGLGGEHIDKVAF